MKDLIHKLGDRVMGVLSGFDRLLFRGTLKCVINAWGLNGYLYGAKVAMRDFDEHARAVSQQLIEESLAAPLRTGCEIRYIEDSHTRKQDVALEIAARDGIRQGRICVLKAVEPCVSFALRRHRETKTIALERRRRKCLPLYHYFHHPRFGLLHVRVQTWFPFTVQVCLNGRNWLARSLDAAGIDYLQHDNCICRVADLPAAQQLLEDQLRVDWRKLLDELRQEVHPAHETIFAHCPEHARHDYWSVAESEWASDLLFRDPSEVLPLCERLVNHSMRVHGAGHVLRFLGRTVRRDGLPRLTFQGEIQSFVREFTQGLRIKHRVNANSVKMYNRPGVLRIETTINDPGDFKVFRTTQADPLAAPAWLRLRRGVADLHRRAQVSHAANTRYATAQAAGLQDDQRLQDLTHALCSRVRRPGRPQPDGSRTRARTFRAFNPLAPEDLALLTAVARPEFVVSGLRNPDLRSLLFGPDPSDAAERRRRSSAISRKLSLLRAHGILEKIAKSHRYRVTTKGHNALTALLAAAKATTKELTQLAA